MIIINSIKDTIVLPGPKPRRGKRARTPYSIFYKEYISQLPEGDRTYLFLLWYSFSTWIITINSLSLYSFSLVLTSSDQF